MAAPERFAEKSDLLLQRGHRPYMARHVTCRDAAICLHLGEQRKLQEHARNDAIDPLRKWSVHCNRRDNAVWGGAKQPSPSALR